MVGEQRPALTPHFPFCFSFPFLLLSSLISGEKETPSPLFLISVKYSLDTKAFSVKCKLSSLSLSLSPSLGLSLFLSHTFSPFLFPPLPTAHINKWNCHLFKFPNILKHILYTLPNHYNHSLGTLTTLCLTVCYCLYFLTILDHFVFLILVKCYLFVCLLVFPPALVCFVNFITNNN